MDVPLTNQTIPTNLPPQKTNYWKIFTFIFLILFIISLSSTIYLFVNKPVCPPATVCEKITPDTNLNSQNCSWQSFESQKLGLKFLYLPELVVNENEKENRINIESSYFTAYIERIENPNNITPENYALNELCKPALETTNRPESSPEESYKFCQKWVTDNLKPYEPAVNIKGYETVYALGEGETWIYIFPHKEKLYLVKGSMDLDIPDDFGLALLKKIIRSVTFLD